MKKKKWLIPILIILGVVIICCVLLGVMVVGSLGFSTGRCLITDNGSYMMVVDERSPIRMSVKKGVDGMFEGLENGDEILVLHDGIQETYPGSTRVYAVFKLRDGDISDISEEVLGELTELGWLSESGVWSEGNSQGQSDSKEDLNGSIITEEDYEATVSWVNYYDGNEFYFGALNADKMAISSVLHLPIWKFETLAELEQFKADFGDDFSMNSGYDETPSFEEATESMDEAFFEDNTVFLVYVSASSGSLRFGVNRIYCDGENLGIYIAQTNAPEALTWDMAGWFVTVSLDKSLVEGCTTFDAALHQF